MAASVRGEADQNKKRGLGLRVYGYGFKLDTGPLSISWMMVSHHGQMMIKRSS